MTDQMWQDLVDTVCTQYEHGEITREKAKTELTRLMTNPTIAEDYLYAIDEFK